MKKLISLMAIIAFVASADAQTLSLDSCRAMALRNNKQLNATKLKREAFAYTRKAARTKYLPKVDALGGYEYFNKEVSILNNDQKSALSHLGTNAMTRMSAGITDIITGMATKGLITPEIARELGARMNNIGGSLANQGDQLGQQINDAFRTDTHNFWSGAVMVRQPIFMGGAIIAANKMADIAEQMASNDYEGKVQNTIYTIDETYWLVVSLKQKKRLAESYRDLVQKLDDDVKKMINEGIATRAAGLQVDVKVNEAEMAITQVDDGLSLAKMLLCQLCGMPVSSDITLEDEDSSEFAVIEETTEYSNETAQNNRTEIKLLENTVDLSRQATKLIRAAYLPHIALTGGYIVSNPNVYNGFEKKFSGVWNVGIIMHIPVWNWFEGSYKVRASKAATAMAELEVSDVREKINLQVAQNQYKLKEAQKRLVTATKNLKNAEENLRCANVGFREGVMESTEVMTAQTAWQAAHTQKIDAEIGVKMSQIALKKALGVLQ